MSLTNEASGEVTSTPASDVETTSTEVNSSVQSSEKVEEGTLLSQELAKEESVEAPKEESIEYKDFSLPEGVALNPEMNGEFKTLAKELNLSQEQAQKLVDLQTKYSNTQMDGVLSDYKQTVESWKQESVKKFGANLNQELSFARKALDTLGNPRLAKFLDDTGFGNHPEFLEFFAKAGKLLSEDRISDGGKMVAPKSLGELFYPDMK